jgi:N-acetylneuraminate synthase
MATISIGNRLVGPEHPPLVIAEVGINHSGSLTVAKEMVDAAHRAGAEVIKHQTHFVEDEMSAAAKSVVPGNADVSIFDIMESCALSSEEELELKKYVEALGMLFISTPFSRAAADFLESIGVPAFKIGSGECNNYPLVEHICEFGKPVILSTGMNSIETIRPAVEIIRSKGISYALLHCTNLYPTPHELVRYGGMTDLAAAFPDAVIGLSDHTVNNNACLGAVALGASILERHFTDTKARSGPDISCSMDELELQQLITGAKEIWMCRGGNKQPAKEEQVTMDFAFATVVTIRPVQAGDIFSMENVWVKRPGVGGIPATDFSQVIGRRASRSIDSGAQITWADVIS